MSGAINIGRLFGISVKIHFSWVFIFALVAGTLAVSYLPSAYSGWPTPSVLDHGHPRQRAPLRLCPGP